MTTFWKYVIPKCLVTQIERHDKMDLFKKNYCLFMHGIRLLRETPSTMLGLLHLLIVRGRIPSNIINMRKKNPPQIRPV